MRKIHWHKEGEAKLVPHESGEILYFTSPLLDQLDWLKHGISTRLGGVSEGGAASLNFKSNEFDTAENVAENYERFCCAVGIEPDSVIATKQVHEHTLEVVGPDTRREGVGSDFTPAECDGLVCNTPGKSLFGYSADCPLVLLADNKNHAIGICHSGWRGTVQEISRHTVEEMGRQYNTRPEDIFAFVAPSICQDCFEVGEEVVDKIKKTIPESSFDKPFYQKPNGKFQLDLWGVIRTQLLELGIPPAQIQLPYLCTMCNPELFYSHRIQGFNRGTSIAFAQIK